MKACAECGAAMVARRENYRDTLAGTWSATIGNVLVKRCPKCGNYEVTFEKLGPLQRALARAVLLKPARLAGEEVTFLRSHLGMTGREIARTLGVSPAALSRWENGKDPIGGISDRALRMLVALDVGLHDALTRESLAVIDGGDRKPLQIIAAMRDGEWIVSTGDATTMPTTGSAAGLPPGHGKVKNAAGRAKTVA